MRHFRFRWPAALLTGVLELLTALSPGEAIAGPPNSSTLPQSAAEGLALPVEDTDSAGEESGLNDLDKLLDEDISTLRQTSVAPALDVEVTSVTRSESSVGKSPAAVFVITNEMIRRSGARSLPDVFRMVPGMHVARQEGWQWSVGMRGASGIFNNKLLVQVDGRTIYTPIFSGVWWQVQDIPLEDIERIEVIRGPGASVWGENAVNGIINIVTKHSADTQGIFVEGGSGTEQRGFVTARVGGRVAQSGTYRAWGSGFDRDGGALPGDVAANGFDTWRSGRGGFRMDWKESCYDDFTVQGDYFNVRDTTRNVLPTLAPPFTQSLQSDHEYTGGYLLTRWTRTFSDDEKLSTQVYYDQMTLDWLGTGFKTDRDTVDIDFQHEFALNHWHQIVWGAGFRHDQLETRAFPFVVEFDPADNTLDRLSYFVQDSITLSEDEWYLILGSKFSHNDFTGFEIQPTARLLWTPTERQSLWAAVSRAVRTPSFSSEANVVTGLPVSVPPAPLIFPQFQGNQGLESEDLLAIEAGMRAQPVDTFYWDLAGYYFRYDELTTSLLGAPVLGDPPTFLILPLPVVNGVHGSTYGFELYGTYEVNECWRLLSGYSFNRYDLTAPANAAQTPTIAGGDYPVNQVYLQSSRDLGHDWELDVIWRYVDSLFLEGVGSYNTVDVRLSWQPSPHVELALVGRNLLQGAHQEFGDDAALGAPATEVEREFFGVVTLRY